MANGDDGMSEVGGGGSVGWKVQVNNGNIPETKLRKGHYKKPPIPIPWGYEVQDTDDVDVRGKFFHVQIQEPGNGTIMWTRQDGAIHLYLPIVNQPTAEGQPRQIRVMWAVDQLPPGLKPL